MKVENLDIITKDKCTLKSKYWLPAGVQAIVCMVHGLGDHMMRHAHVAQYLAEHQIAAVLFDQRGHGTSAGERGHTPSYDALLDDIQAVLANAQKLCPDVPLFLYGHSMGGNEVANYVLKRDISLIRGVIISSPWFRLSFNPSAIKVALGTMMNKIYPSFTQPNEINAEHLTHDPAVGKAYIDDTLVHNEISARLFVGVYQAGEWAINHASELKIPALVMHGSDDGITSIAATKEFVERAGEKVTFKIWEGLRHETHNEVKKAEVIRYIKNWLHQQIEKQENQKVSY